MWIKKVFKYVEPLWCGADGRLSLRNLGAMTLIIDFVINIHNSAIIALKVLNLIYQNKTIDPLLVSSMSGNLAQVTLMLTAEAGLIVALLGLTTYQNMAAQKIDSLAANPIAASDTINIANAQNVGSRNTAETVNTEKIGTVNTQNTTITSKKEEELLDT